MPRISQLPLVTTVEDGDTLVVVRQGVTSRALRSTVLAGAGEPLPDQSGQSGTFLSTDGTDPSWQTVTFPVTSVLGRTGNVTATTGDYSVAQVTGAAPLASPALTGVPTAPTATALTATAQVATTAYADAAVSTLSGTTSTALALKAPIASPTLTGIPAAPTATAGTNTAQLATTAFVQASLPAVPVTSVFGRTGSVVLQSSDVATVLGTLAAANGQLLVGNGTGLVLAALTGTVNQVVVTGGAGTITLSAPQDIHTGATPTFAGVNASSVLSLKLGGVTKAQLDSTGLVVFDSLTVGSGTAADTVAVVDTAAGFFRLFAFRTAGSVRWFAGTDNTAESGSDAGSDFIFDRFSDAGSYLGQPLTIRRSTGDTRLTGFITPRTSAPADSDLAAGELTLWGDDGNVYFKKKTSGGTIKTATIPLT